MAEISKSAKRILETHSGKSVSFCVQRIDLCRSLRDNRIVTYAITPAKMIKNFSDVFSGSDFTVS